MTDVVGLGKHGVDSRVALLRAFGGEGFLALGTVESIGTVSAVDGHVYDLRSRFIQGCAKGVQVLRVHRGEGSGPRLNLVDVEFLNHVSGKILKFDGGIAALVLLA